MLVEQAGEWILLRESLELVGVALQFVFCGLAPRDVLGLGDEMLDGPVIAASDRERRQPPDAPPVRQ